jgi:hypothetical protein
MKVLLISVGTEVDGYFLNKSTTHTHYEQGAWWQVDLGGEKNIKQIIIHNRTDCCVNRLSNYQVSVAGFPRARLVVPAPTAITTVTVS